VRTGPQPPGIEYGDGRRERVLEVARANLKHYIAGLCSSVGTAKKYADVIDDLQVELAGVRVEALREQVLCYSS
jgi:hypothetical protein